MKIEKKFIGILSIIALIIIGGLVWWNIPCSITSISPSEVSKIEIFDGNTGKAIIITDASEIKHIIDNLNSISLKKEKFSLGYMGYSFRTTIYKANGDVYSKFIINSSDTIRKDPFFCRDSSGRIDYKYIQDLVGKNAK